MKVLLDIEDQKAEFVLELLKNLNFVKVEPLSPYKAKVYENLKKSVEEMNQVQEGKIKAISAKDLLDEL